MDKNNFSSFSRYNFLKKKNQAIAVDFDCLLIIASHNSPELNELFVNTILCGFEGEAEIIFVFTKSDLPFSENDKEVIQDLKNAGFGIVLTSIITNEGIEEIKKKINKKRVLLVGESAGGKSSLINAIAGRYLQDTGEVSQKNNKGCHTTTSSKVIDCKDYILIDTPGVRYVLPPIDTQIDFDIIFPEFKNYECKFRNCKHINEIECGVKKAVDENKISTKRYNAYLKLIELIGKHKRT